MSEEEKLPEAIVFSITPADGSADVRVTFAFPTAGPVEVFQDDSIVPEDLMKRYSLVLDNARILDAFSYFESDIALFEVPMTKFFSQATGVEVIELATYAVGSIFPIRFKYHVTRNNGRITLSLHSGLASALSDAQYEERNELEKGSEDLKASSPRAFSPWRKNPKH
jgi:hypothetical protein